MAENTVYTLEELKNKYPPRMRSVDELENTEKPELGPLDFLYIDDWEDLSKVGADLHDMDRLDCEDEINNSLDIQFVQCQYEGKYSEEKDTKLLGSLVAIVPFAFIDADYAEMREMLGEIMRERGFGAQGTKTQTETEEEVE